MKEMLVQFKSGRTLDVRDICDYVESQDFDVVVVKSKDDKKERHITIFHDAVEYMIVTDDDISETEDEVKNPEDICVDDRQCSTCVHKEVEIYNYPCNNCPPGRLPMYEKEEK